MGLLALRSAVRPHLAALAPGDIVAIAVSGGADSLALAGAIALEAKKLSLKIIGVTVDHQLQSGSSEQALKVIEQLHQLGITETIVKTVDVVMEDGLEASARRARYAAFEEISADVIFLGHTKDDQAETVLLGLARGSGGRSLSGMAERTGKYLRPLLGITRKETVAACHELNVKPWQDPHNFDNSYLRVRVREKVIPIMEEEIGPGIVDALVRTANLLRDDSDALDSQAREFWNKDQSLAVDDLEQLPRAVRTRVLRIAIREFGGEPLSMDQVAAVEALVTNWKGQGEVSVPGGVKVSRISGRLSLSKR